MDRLRPVRQAAARLLKQAFLMLLCVGLSQTGVACKQVQPRGKTAEAYGTYLLHIQYIIEYILRLASKARLLIRPNERRKAGRMAENLSR